MCSHHNRTAWLLRIYHNLPKENIFFVRKNAGDPPSWQQRPILPASGSGTFICPLEEPARDKREFRIAVTARLTPNVNFHFTNMFYNCLSFTVHYIYRKSSVKLPSFLSPPPPYYP